MRNTHWILLIGAQLLFTIIAKAQATFEFLNLRGGGGGVLIVDAPVFDASGNPLAGPDYLAELYGGPEPSALSAAISVSEDNRSIAPFLTGEFAGYFSPRSSGRSVEIPGTVAGEFAWLQVRAWKASLGVTYEQAEARGLGGYGESPIFSAKGGSEASLIIPGPLIGLESFNLRPVIPEPGVLWLLLIGLPILFLDKKRRY